MDGESGSMSRCAVLWHCMRTSNKVRGFALFILFASFWMALALSIHFGTNKAVSFALANVWIAFGFFEILLIAFTVTLWKMNLTDNIHHLYSCETADNRQAEGNKKWILCIGLTCTLIVTPWLNWLLEYWRWYKTNNDDGSAAPTMSESWQSPAAIGVAMAVSVILCMFVGIPIFLLIHLCTSIYHCVRKEYRNSQQSLLGFTPAPSEITNTTTTTTTNDFPPPPPPPPPNDASVIVVQPSFPSPNPA